MQPMPVQIIKAPFTQRLIRNPFKYYCRAGGMTFCGVFGLNTLSLFFDKEKRTMLREHPEFTVMGLAIKSSYYGILWPAAVFSLLFYPRNMLVFGSGFEN